MIIKLESKKIGEKLIQSLSKKVFESTQDEPKLIGAILEFKEGKKPLSITIGKLYPVEKINKYLESEDVAVNFQNQQDIIGGYDKAYVDLVFEYKGIHYRAHLLRYDLGDLYEEYVTNESIEYAKNKVKEYAEGAKSYSIYEVDPINYKRIENIVREDVNKDAEELAISNDLASAIMDAIKSEFDAVNEYNDLIVLAEVLDKPEIAKIAHSIANEEKAHVGELQKALAMIDPTFESSLESGEQEILDIVKESYTGNSLFNLLKKQGKTLGDMREYQYQRNIAKQLGVDLDKVDELILSGKGYEDISEYIYNNADKKEYKKVYHQDDTLEENFKDFNLNFDKYGIKVYTNSFDEKTIIIGDNKKVVLESEKNFDEKFVRALKYTFKLTVDQLREVFKEVLNREPDEDEEELWFSDNKKASRELYRKIFPNHPIKENLEEEDEKELINQFYKDASLELIKEVIEEYDGSEDTEYLEHVNNELKRIKKNYENATKEELISIIKYDVDSYILDNYISEYDKQEYFDEYDRLDKEEQEHQKDLQSYWRSTRI